MDAGGRSSRSKFCEFCRFQFTGNVERNRGPIASTTDIGYQSVNAADVASSTCGWAFDPGSDFSVAVDFDLTFGDPDGGFSIGFGIGEDSAGTDSAGVALLTNDGSPLPLIFPIAPFIGAARDNDSLSTLSPINLTGQLNGRFIVAYDESSGDVTVGVSTNGDDETEEDAILSGIQNSWDDDPLLVSFFARGGNGAASWQSGTADTIFSNFRVISGAPFAVGNSCAVPEPTSFAIILVNLLAVMGFCTYRRRKVDN